MPSHTRLLAASSAIAMIVAFSALGCAHKPSSTSIDQRPTPPQPGPVATTTPDKPTSSTDLPTPSSPPTGTTTPSGSSTRAAADTLAARRAMNRCAGRNLLPEQESTIATVSSLLRSANAALLREDFTRAESLARQARQLAGSLGCP